MRKKPNTLVALTKPGRERVARHWEQLERLKALAGQRLSTTRAALP